MRLRGLGAAVAGIVGTGHDGILGHHVDDIAPERLFAQDVDACLGNQELSFYQDIIEPVPVVQGMFFQGL